MATAEAEASGDEQVPPRGLVYDGFTSYSHAADDLLAPRLQSGLQRFAKPWWKRRALRIFRDESSLSANPHLWSSITDALDQSAWFVLLLSPEAAESPWVNNEVEYWLEHKDPGRIIPVLTDGDFTWFDDDFISDAAPPALQGAFSDEPRWVDLRFARTEEQLDLKNPRFSAAIADIASAIRGVPKDELESEDVRQHRRTVRTAWAAGVGLLILAAIAGATAVYALDQRSEAVANAARADEYAAEAAALAEAERLAREEADQRTTEAEQLREEAEQQAAIAQAREVVLEAEKTLESDPELSTHLALASLAAFQQTGEDPAQAVSALRQAIANDRVAWRIPGGDFVAVHPDGSLLATADGDDVAVWDIATRQVVEPYAREGGGYAGGAAFSPDGNLLAVVFQGGEPAVTVWDRTTGESFTLGIHPGGFLPGLVFSPDGALLAFRAGIDKKTGEGGGLEVWSVSDRVLVYGDELGGGPDFNADGLLSYLVRGAGGEGEMTVSIVDPASWTEIHTLSTGIPSSGAGLWTSWSPDGDQIAAADQGYLVVLDAETGTAISRTEGIVHRPEWLPGGDAFMVGGLVVPRLIEATTGEVRLELVGPTGGVGTWDYDVVPGTTLVAAAALGPTDFVRGRDTVLFDTAPVLGELGGWSSPVDPFRVASFVTNDRVVVAGRYGDGSYVIANAVDGDDPDLVAGGSSDWYPDINANATFLSFADTEGEWSLRVAATGEVTYEAPPGWRLLGANWDGTKAMIRQPVSTDPTAECPLSRIVSTLDGSLIAELSAVGCSTHPYFSPDGSLVYTGNFDAEAGLFDSETGALLVDFTATDYFTLGAAFTPDGSELIVMGSAVYVLDVETLLSGAPIEDAVKFEFPGLDTFAQSVSVSPDGAMLAAAGRSDPLKVWDLATGELLDEFGGKVAEGFHVGTFHPSLPHLIVTTPPNEIRIHTFDIEELVALGRASLSREMTEEECQAYFRRACSES